MVKFIISAIGFAIALGIFFMYTQPMYDRAQALQKEIGKYNQALGKAAELQQLKQALLSRYNAFNPEDLTRLQKLLPDHVDNVRLVLDLDSLAGMHSMALQNVVISNPSSEMGDSSSIGAIGVSRQKFDSLTLKFSTRASYSRFVQFLESLESSLRIVDLVSLNLVSDTAPGSSAEEPQYRFDITIRTYWLK